MFIVKKAEREVFDKVASTIVKANPNVLSGNKSTQQLLFALIKESSHSPQDLLHVVKSVVKLPEEDLKDLSELLERTSLESLLRLGTMVTERLDFIRMLEDVVYENNLRKHVKERRHLHKILEQEPWFFGEEYSIYTSDESLNQVLKAHKTVMGEVEFLAELSPDPNLNDIPDLVLGAQGTNNKGDAYHNLVIEIKRPSVKLGVNELNQLSKYQRAIELDPRFDKERTKWTFLLVSSDITEDAVAQSNQPNRTKGLYLETNHSKSFVKTWAELIQDAKGRMNYLKNKLEISPQVKDGMDYLQKKHPDIHKETGAKIVNLESHN